MARPIYGNGFFHVTPGTIFYTIVFEYSDEEEEYYSLISRGSEGEEEERLRAEMQRILDDEKIVINSSYSRALVLSAKAEVRGLRRLSSATFFIEIPYRPLSGTNTYENMYEEAVAEYDYTVYWIMPRGGRIKSFDISGEARLSEDGRVLSVRVRSGTKVKGYESVAFELPQHVSVNQ